MRKGLLLSVCLLAFNLLTNAQKAVVKGVVNSDNGMPLFKATVQARNLADDHKDITMTDSLGYFYFDKLAANAAYSFKISLIGYKEKTLTGYKLKPNDTTNILVTLMEDTSHLSDVVVTGFQNVSRSKFSGAATKVDISDVMVSGQTDISRMLQGQVAGVSVQNVSGTFGAAPKIRIRGATSLSGDNKPLWVVDGVVLEDIVPISNDQLSSGDPATMLGSSVAGLNANDIESMEILKDAAATALYGGRAMNGVVVVTTRKGKKGALKINYTGNFTTSLKPSYSSYNIMNSGQQLSAYSEMASKGWLNFSDVGNRSSYGVYGKMYQLLNTYDSTTGKFALYNSPEAKDSFLRRYANANTDWFDVLFRNELVQEHNISFMSGSEKNQTFASLSYYGDNGWSIADKVKRLTFNFNNTFTPNDKLTISLTARASYRDQRAPGANSRKSNPVNGQFDRDFDINPFSYALNTSRALTPYDANGDLEFFRMNYAPFNIIYELENNYQKVGVLDVSAQAEVKYKLSKHFTYQFLGAVRAVNTNTETIINENSNAAEAYRADYTTTIANNNKYLYSDPDHPNDQPVIILPAGGFYNKAEVQMKTYNFRNMLVYNQTFNDIHTVSIMGGQEVRSVDRQNYSALGPGLQYNMGGVPFIDYRFYKKFIESNNLPYDLDPSFERTASFFADMQYTFKNRYNLEYVFRYDGGNKLGRSPQARWLPTSTIAASWNVSREAFMDGVTFVNDLKLRASYGKVGSLGKATNAAAVYKSGTSIRPYLDEKETELLLQQLENSDLTWEKADKFDVGIDGSVLNKRLRFTMDYYYNKSYDLIDNINTTGIGGEYTKAANNANLTGKGFELSLNGDIVASNDVLWTLGVNFGTNYNKITKTTTLPMIWDLIRAEGGNFVGHPVESLYSIDFNSLSTAGGLPYFINEDGQVSNNVYFQARQFTDKDGNSVPIDKVLVYNGPVAPPFTGGVNSYFRWKNWSLNLNFYFQSGNKIRLDPIFKNAYTDLDAFPKEFDDRWVQPGDEKVTSIPAIMDVLYNERNGSSNLYNSYNYSTERVAKGDEIRLKSMQVAYMFPASITQKLKISNLSMSLTGNNVWLIYSDKKLHGQDPEFFNTGGVASPVNKQYTLSLKVGF
ncbi:MULTISPECIES: SusC/RagA family TonB-linked outer membrane protein [Chitinophagaceae]